MARTEPCKDCPLNNGETHQINSSDDAHRVEVAQYHQLSNQSIDHLAGLVTGITLTDPGPNVREQPSKLFTTRETFQELRATDLPTFNPVPLPEVTDGFQRLLRSAKHPGMRSVERNKDLLVDILQQVQTARMSLDSIDVLYAENDDHRSMRLAVDAATEVVISSGKRLGSVKTPNGDLVRLKDEVLAELRELDQRIDCLGALLPKEVAITETAPLPYDAAHVHINPVGHLDLIAQMMVLLAVVCNVILGLSTQPCDLLIQSVQMIIRLVMSMNLAADAEEYNLEQQHVLGQLPRSLRAALDTFKLDAKTTVLRSVPLLATSRMHRRSIVSLVIECTPASATTTFSDRMARDSAPSRCWKTVTENFDRSSLSFTSLFVDHLARLLSDPQIEEMLVAPFALEESAEQIDEPLAPHGDEDQEMPLVPESGENPVAEPRAAYDSNKLRKALLYNNLAALRFVCYSLDLDISAAKLKKADYADKLIVWRLTQPLAGFEHDWMSYTDQVELSYQLRNPEVEKAQVLNIQLSLTKPLVPEDKALSDVPAVVEGDEESLEVPVVPEPLPARPDPEKSNVEKAAGTLTKALKSYNLPSLRFVAYSLGLDMSGPDEKSYYAAKLTAWVSLINPLVNPHFVSRAIDLTKLKFIQRVIANTVTPSWVNSVPKNYGESNAGTIKADEWRILATIYLPIALILLWGDWAPQDGGFAEGSEASRLLGMLDHSMALFQAVVLACRFTVTFERATAYRDFIKDWGLISTRHSISTTSFYFFGPIVSWWCFPFERLIGVLQKIKTNDWIGGELEATITKSFTRGANLRRWLNRPDCPEVIKEFKRLFDRAYTPRRNLSEESPPLVADGERAHYTYQGVNFSRASTHLGNSLILYRPSIKADPIAGSIEKIVTQGDDTYFVVRRQAPLPPDTFDPFLRYPHFPAKSYSSQMDDATDTIISSLVVSHCARFEYSNNRSVILNLSRN
ncbi:hypothetical protein MVEN_02215300 [Mycena venus]|uniref:Uncharacterized protein n=1 Tax=Mycena venus TaxID=2733690 RepID=A0A8H7CGZ3_9AGAR|nr:hypothetical protein MVEN_02215300 [Mycena venus]